MDAFSELKGLSDSADVTINIGNHHNKRLAEWFEIVKQIALTILKDENKITEISSSNADSSVNIKIPSIVSFISEAGKVSHEKRRRISSTLAHMQNKRISHVTRSSRHFESKDLNCERSKFPEQCTTINETFVKCDNAVKASVSEYEKEKCTSMLNREQKEECFTPVTNRSNISQLSKLTETKIPVRSEQTSCKRKSSRLSSISVSIKKIKIVQSEIVSVQKKMLGKSIRGTLGKFSESKLPKHVNYLLSTKISTSSAPKLEGGEVNLMPKKVKEAQVKIQDAQVKIQKAQVKIQKAQVKIQKAQVKIQEGKRKREEKTEKASQQRLKLENEHCLRKNKVKEVEKPLLKTVLDPKKTRRKEVKKNDIYTEVKGSIKEIKASNSVIPFKTTRKNEAKKNIEQENKSEKRGMQKVCLTQSSSSVLKEICSKDLKVVDPIKAGFTKILNTIQQTSSSSVTFNGPSKHSLKAKVATPLTMKQNKSNMSNIPSPKSVQSYEMTPVRSSYVSYDISEIKSDDSDDEEPKSNPKPFPAWASGVHLRNYLLQQHYYPMDTDLLFGNVFDTPNLKKIMGVESKKYFRRTSSAMWNSPLAFK